MHAPSAAVSDVVPPVGSWSSEVTSDQWKAFVAAYLAGSSMPSTSLILDVFLVVDIQRSFTVNSALAGALGTVTPAFRWLAASALRTALDRWGGSCR